MAGRGRWQGSLGRQNAVSADKGNKKPATHNLYRLARGGLGIFTEAWRSGRSVHDLVVIPLCTDVDGFHSVLPSHKATDDAKGLMSRHDRGNARFGLEAKKDGW